MEKFLTLYREAIKNRGLFFLALSGGKTPRKFYAKLAELPEREIDWSKVHFFWSDERMVAHDNAESNFRMAYDSLISKIKIPVENIHAVRTDLPPRAAAVEYENEIKKILGSVNFDLILLGIGPDGHTASLFPATKALNKKLIFVANNFVPKLNAWRITFTFPLINASRCVMFVVDESDPQKAEITAKIKKGPDPNLPASLVKTADIEWLDVSKL